MLSTSKYVVLQLWQLKCRMFMWVCSNSPTSHAASVTEKLYMHANWLNNLETVTSLPNIEGHGVCSEIAEQYSWEILNEICYTAVVHEAAREQSSINMLCSDNLHHLKLKFLLLHKPDRSSCTQRNNIYSFSICE